jgi:uncharacterized protein (TIRG00374 family)
MQPSTRPQKGKLTDPAFWLVLLLALGLLAFAIYSVGDWSEVWARLRAMSISSFVILLALALVNYLCRGVRWHLFSRQIGLPTRAWQNILHFMGGFAMSVTPGRIGELIRLRWINRSTGWTLERTLPLALVDRAADLAAMGIVLALSLLLSSGGFVAGLVAASIAISVAYLITRPDVMHWLVVRVWKMTGRWPRLFARMRRATDMLRRFKNPWTLISAMVLGVGGWLAEGYSLYLLLGWLGEPLGFWTANGVFVFAMLAGGSTGAPAGLGGSEAALAGLLTLNGVGLDVALTATIIIRITTFWFSVALGWIMLPFAEGSGPRKTQK